MDEKTFTNLAEIALPINKNAAVYDEDPQDLLPQAEGRSLFFPYGPPAGAMAGGAVGAGVGAGGMLGGNLWAQNRASAPLAPADHVNAVRAVRLRRNRLLDAATRRTMEGAPPEGLMDLIFRSTPERQYKAHMRNNPVPEVLGRVQRRLIHNVRKARNPMMALGAVGGGLAGAFAGDMTDHRPIFEIRKSANWREGLGQAAKTVSKHTQGTQDDVRKLVGAARSGVAEATGKTPPPAVDPSRVKTVAAWLAGLVGVGGTAAGAHHLATREPGQAG